MQELENIMQEIEEMHCPIEGIGCGLEDAGITDRYEAAEYGWNEAVEMTSDVIRNYLSDMDNDGWIPVEERLPTKEECEKDNNEFLVQTDGGERFSCEYDPLANGYDNPLWCCNVPVVAWQTLPRSYRPERNERMTDADREIKRLVSYIRSCREANIDCTVTIDKSLTHVVLNALEEIQQYRKIGTVEELVRAKRYIYLAKKHGTIGQMIDECVAYEEIGTVEECREAVDKQAGYEIAE